MNENLPIEPEQKKLNIWLPLLFAITAVGCIMLGFELRKAAPVNVEKASISSFSSRSEVGKIEEMLRYIESKYVDEVEREKIMEAAIKSMLKELDPHSNYIPEEQLQSINESLEGSFDGIGVSFFILVDTLYVVSVVENGPSEEAGILPGDKIVQINDSTIAGIGISNSDVIDLLRGQKGSKVNLGIKRKGNEDLLNVTVTRASIPDKSIEVSYMVDDKTGYIKVSRFSNTTYEEFMKSVENLNGEGMENLIIDVRQNNGGYLSAVTKMVDQLFDDGRKLIVYTQGRTQRRSDYKTSGRNFFPIDQIMVLVDEGSASASEILAGAVQDWDRGTVIGRRTFGKGLVQEQYKLSDGSALRLTVARYYTPSGRSIQKEYSSDESEYGSSSLTRLQTGELLSRDSIKITDSTEYQTASGRVVYGGGGIIPDEFVPIDTVVYNEYYSKARAYLQEFVYYYFDRHSGSKTAYETIDDFNKRFEVNNSMMTSFIDYVGDKGVVYNETSFSDCRSKIEHQLKSFVARQYFEEEGLFRVLNDKDPVYRKALELID
ncbi:MAG: S41 family peptidase [Bacteroidota bacterium]